MDSAHAKVPLTRIRGAVRTGPGTLELQIDQKGQHVRLSMWALPGPMPEVTSALLDALEQRAARSTTDAGGV